MVVSTDARGSALESVCVQVHCSMTGTSQFQFCDTLGGVGKHQRERCLLAEVQNIALLSCAQKKEISTSRPVGFGSPGVGSFEGGRHEVTKSWKLFCLLPFWLLRRPQSKQFDKFANGQ